MFFSRDSIVFLFSKQVNMNVFENCLKKLDWINSQNAGFVYIL